MNERVDEGPTHYRPRMDLARELATDLSARLRPLVDAAASPGWTREQARDGLAQALGVADDLAKLLAEHRAGQDIEAQQLEQIVEVLTGVAALDFGSRVTLRSDGGTVDAVAVMANMLAEETAAALQTLAERNAELQRAKDVAEAATAAKSQFLAIVSHEIRTPLTALLGFSDLLLAPRLGESDRLNYALVVRRNGEHLLSVVNDVLDLAKIEAGKLDLMPVECSISEVLSSVTSLMRTRAAERGLEFSLRFITPVPEIVRTDPTRLRQILLNLVGNAVKFTPKGSVQVLVRHEPAMEPPQLVIDVVDTGIGITDEQMSLIFQPFHQADRSMSRRFGGTGLGLAICRQIATALGGSISVRSVPGGGSTFTFTCAAAAPPGARLIDGITERAAPVAQGASQVWEQYAGTVLLAEDGPDNQILIGIILRQSGLSVTVAENGEVACARVVEAVQAGTPFDLILMDMQMPVLDGYAAATRLRRQGHRGPIVALTAHAMEGERERCIAAGCDAYLSKPIDRAELAEVLKRYVGGEPIASTLADDPEMAAAIAGFVQGLPATVASMREAAGAHDRERLQRLAHRLKGAGGGYGYAAITEAAARLEDAVRAGEEPGTLVDELEAICRRARRGAPR